MIELHGVSFAYEKEDKVLDALDLELRPGLTLLLGPNGCGKSTLLKLAAGVEKPDAGTVLVGGFDLWKEEVEARRMLSYLPEQPDLTPYATIKEILDLVCRLRGEPLRAGEDALTFFGLQGLFHRTVRELSMGQRRRAVFAAALVGGPTCFLLDEPLEGLDRGIQQDIIAWLKERARSGASLLVVSHALEPFLPIADRAMTLVDGKGIGLDELPSDPGQKLRQLEALARGENRDEIAGLSSKDRV